MGGLIADIFWFVVFAAVAVCGLVMLVTHYYADWYMDVLVIIGTAMCLVVATLIGQSIYKTWKK